MTVAELTTKYRERLGLTQEEADAKCTMFKGYCRNIENGSMIPILDHAKRMAYRLGMGEDIPLFIELCKTHHKNKRVAPPKPNLPWTCDVLSCPHLVVTATGKRPTIAQLRQALKEAERQAASKRRMKYSPDAICSDPAMLHPALDVGT